MRCLARLQYTLECWPEYYDRFLPHQAPENVLPDSADRPALPMKDTPIAHVVCRKHLGGLLKRNERKVA